MTQPRKARPKHDSRAKSGDPSSLALRVQRIIDVVQVRGYFERLPSATEEQLLPEFVPVHAQAELIGDNEVAVALVFGFVARVSQPNVVASQTHSTNPGDPAHDVRMVVEAGYVARYELSKGPAPNQPDLQKFAEINGRLNLTPYWREFLDSSLRRAGLPPMMVPVFKSNPSKAPSSSPPARRTKRDK